jgi:hypothetical protein
MQQNHNNSGDKNQQIPNTNQHRTKLNYSNQQPYMLRHKQHIGPIPVLTTTKAHTRKITDGRGGAINGMFRGDARGGKVGTNQTKQGQVTRQTQQGRKRAHGKYLTSLVPSGTNVPRQIGMRLANKIKAVSVSTSETK